MSLPITKALSCHANSSRGAVPITVLHVMCVQTYCAGELAVGNNGRLVGHLVVFFNVFPFSEKKF